MYYLTLRMLQIVTVLLATVSAVMAVVDVPALLLLPAAYLAFVAKRVSGSLRSHGTARWADQHDVQDMIEADDGIIIGYAASRAEKSKAIRGLFDRNRKSRRAVLAFVESFQRKAEKDVLLRLSDAVHTTVIAPSGAGKNTSIVFPFLQTTRESVVVCDFKGENARLTAEHRARVLGQKVVLIDPFKEVTQRPDAFNVLAFIDPDDPACIDECRAIAEALIVKEPNAKEPHWSQKAEIFVCGAILAVVTFLDPEHRNLQKVVEIITNRKMFAAAVARLQACDNHHGLLARFGNEMAGSAERELDSIISTAARSLNFLSTAAVVDSTTCETNELTLADLRNPRGVSVYLVLPTKYARSHTGLMRLWTTAILRMALSRGTVNPKAVNFVLDECAQMGRVEAVEDALSIGRGYGVKVIGSFQHMSQLKKVVPEGQEGIWLANTTQVFFAVQDNQTAQYVSDYLGEFTQVVHGGGTNTGTSTQSGQHNSATYSSGSSTSWQAQGRRLLQPAEVIGLDPRIALTFAPGRPPIATRLVRHYEGFLPNRPVGPVKAFVDTLCLFLLALFAFAVVAAAAGNIRPVQ